MSSPRRSIVAPAQPRFPSMIGHGSPSRRTNSLPRAPRCSRLGRRGRQPQARNAKTGAGRVSERAATLVTRCPRNKRDENALAAVCTENAIAGRSPLIRRRSERFSRLRFRGVRCTPQLVLRARITSVSPGQSQKMPSGDRDVSSSRTSLAKSSTRSPNRCGAEKEKEK
jgi:hypothetical protein